MLEIVNNGQALVSTNYWQTEHANVGLLYVTINAGAIRLLVPEAAEGFLAEMGTAGSVTIERSIRAEAKGCVDIVFEDGTDSPFSVAIDERQIDRALGRGWEAPFTIWTQRGLQAEFLAVIK